MKKFAVICGFVGLALMVNGCSSSNQVIRIEHHVYFHNAPMMHGARLNQNRPNRRFNQSKGIDPRYDHKPGMMPPKKDK